MEVINPINAQTVAPYMGRQVCAVLHDGTCYYGTLAGIDGGQLVLNGATQEAYTLSTNEKKAKSQILKQKDAKTSAFGYAGFGGIGYGRGYALDLALISLLFLLPFLWI